MIYKQTGIRMTHAYTYLLTRLHDWLRRSAKSLVRADKHVKFYVLFVAGSYDNRRYETVFEQPFRDARRV